MLSTISNIQDSETKNNETLNLDFVLMSPYYLKEEYFGMILKVMNIFKIYSFIPLTSLSIVMQDDVKRYSFYEHHYASGVYDSTFWDEIELDIRTFNKKTNKNVFGNPTILILCDTEYENSNNIEKHTYVEPYYWEDFNDEGELESFWDWRVNIYPFGDVKIGLSRCISRFKTSDYRLHSAQMRIIEIAVFFSNMEELSSVWDYERGDRHYIARSKLTGKTATYVFLLKQRLAKENEVCLIYTDSDGKRRIRRLVIDEAYSEFKKFAEYKEYEREQQRYSSWQTYQNDDSGSEDEERGCGNGWSCDSCPNYGCPANEQN